jgi:hypothetical protein
VLKISLLLNSSVTLLAILINFIFKIYLTRKFPSNELVVYYTIIDIVTLAMRFFIGFKDALVTTYNKIIDTYNKIRFLNIFTILFTIFIAFVGFCIIPFSRYFLMFGDINGSQINWLYLSFLFIILSFNSYIDNLLLLRKYNIMLSILSIAKVILFVLVIFLETIIVKDYARYNVLIITFISVEFIIFLIGCFTIFIKLDKKYIKMVITYYKFDFKERNIIENIKMSFVSSFGFFIYGVLLFAPVFMMTREENIAELGNFQVVARSIYFALISICSWPLGRFLFPHISRLIGYKNFIEVKIIQRKIIILLIIFGVASITSCWLLSKMIIGYIFPEQYINSYEMINILIVALPFVMYVNFSDSIIKSYGLYNIIIVIRAVGLLSFIFMYYILYFIEVEYASIYSFVLSMLSIFVVSAYCEKRTLRDNIKL